MENMIRRQGVGFNDDFQIANMEIPDETIIKNIEAGDLAKWWDNPNEYTGCQKLANKWYDSMESLALKVPSAALSVCYNYLLNTLHPDFSTVKLVKVTPLNARCEN